jgi:hypothetical protein
MIHGLAVSPTVTAHRQVKDPAGCRFSLPLPLLLNHGEDADGRELDLPFEQMKVGDITWAARTARGWFVRGVICDNAIGDIAWKLIQLGATPALSVRWTAGVVSGTKDGVQHISACRLTEISLMVAGANPDARLEIFDPTAAPRYGRL